MSQPVTCPTLERAALESLIDGRILALRVPRFVDSDLAAKLATWFADHPERQNYRTSNARGELLPSDTDRVGTPLSALYPGLLADPSALSTRDLEDYALASRVLAAQVRGVCAPAEAPIDAVLEAMRAAWNGGARRASFFGLPIYAGIARVNMMASGALLEEQPHMDWLPPKIAQFSCQLSAVVYLELPSVGGELEIWDFDEEDSVAMYKKFGQLKREEMTSSYVVCPEVGDLVVFNTRRPHRVRRFHSGNRIVQTAFVGYSPDGDRQLVFWS